MFRTRIRPLAVSLFLGLPLVAGCSAIDAEMTRNMDSTGDDFQKALHMQYLELAVAENDEGDAEDAVYFNNKAMMAAKGQAVSAQSISERSIASEFLPDIEKADVMLTNAMLEGWADRDPRNAARAQSSFDCWIQEQEENTQQEHIDACRLAFGGAMALYRPKEKEKMAEPALPDLPGPVTVYFAFDNFDLSELAIETLDKAGEQAKAAQATAALVTGHADAAGSSDYNKGLSRARAVTVRNALIERGMTRKQVTRKFVGEEDLAVKTEDGKREARNRRVTITFSR